jgi:hypothetical protein
VLWHSAFKHREKYIYIYWKIKREEISIAILQELASNTYYNTPGASNTYCNTPGASNAYMQI